MPSSKILKSKETKVDLLAEKVRNAVCGVISDYKGINVADDTKLRKSLREADVDYFVVKNTMLRRAFEKAGITGLDDLLSGPPALALSKTDVIAAPKHVYKQVEASVKSPLPYTIKGGFIEGKAASAAVITEYAKLPTKEVLISKLLFVLQSPMQKLAIGVSEVAKLKGGDAVAEVAPVAVAEVAVEAAPVAEVASAPVAEAPAAE